MPFDPFGDYETRGYLRNVAGSKDTAEIAKAEFAALRVRLPEALAALKAKKTLTYEDLLATHRRLFSAVYPWAGQDRRATAPEIAIAKGDRADLFAHPAECRRAAEYALRRAQDPAFMRRNPGLVFGELAYAHPFLEGNGRTIITVHEDLCRRAGIHIDWTATTKRDFLQALTAELDRPGSALDAYLKPFVRAGARDLAKAHQTVMALAGTASARKALPDPREQDRDGSG